jgi:hypothetical protein
MYNNYGEETQSLKYPLGSVGSGCSDPDEFKAACDSGEGGCCGCDGVPNSGKTLDSCGSCLDSDAASRITDATRCTEIFLIKLPNGIIVGPYTKDEIKTGMVSYTDDTTGTSTSYAVEPDTLVANAVAVDIDAPITYGQTSKEEEYLLAWQSIYVDSRDDVLNSTSEVGVDNVVYVRARIVQRTSEYVPLKDKDGFVGVEYPFCTGASYRDGHRLHGKKTGANYLGIVTTDASMPDNWEDALGKSDFSWNRHRERILDVIEGWADQRCTCAADWRESPEPMLPTCERVWIQASEEIERAQTSRSWADGSWRVSGGWWVQDFGQKTTVDQEGKRGPRRIDSFGTLKTTLTRTATQENDAYGACDYKAMRVVDSDRNTLGAIWHPSQQEISNGFNASFKFMVTQPSVKCEIVQSVSGAFVQSLHTSLYDICATSGGDGFALVFRDDTSSAPSSVSIGAGGSGLGYSGIPNSIAIEFDTVFNAEYNEPRESHVAIHTRGKSANSAHASASLATVALDGSISGSKINDGQVHDVLVTYTPNISVDDMFYMIESGQITGLSAALTSHTADSLGVLSVYLDDVSLPIMSVPYNFDSLLREGSTSVWVGFTASSGELWQAVDILEWNMTTS